MGNKNLELYIHIPFCQRKCLYCDFLSGPADEAVREEYLSVLHQEIENRGRDMKAYLVTSIFIGGGTPSILGGEQIIGLMECVREHFTVSVGAEITIECNPGTLNAYKLDAYKIAGINRISLGLQSADDDELMKLGRIHTYKDFVESFSLARQKGFHNINVDLMSGLPGQTADSWNQTLHKVLRLKPEHISAYSLIIEEGTFFHQLYGEDNQIREDGGIPKKLPTEELEREMYVQTELELSAKGYEHYEISNYAKHGFQCKHNVGYWTRENYLGLGLGAASLIEEIRFSNTRDMEEYLKGEFEPEDLVRLSRKDQIEEYMFLGLRLLKGITRQGFKERFGVEVEAVYGDTIKHLQEIDMITCNEGVISLTPEGIDLSNYIYAQFLLDELNV